MKTTEELLKTIRTEIERLYDGDAPKHDQQCDFDDGYFTGIGAISKFLDTLQEQPEMDLKKFTEKMDSWKARFSRPDDIPIKATMAFTARMFFMYPNVARQWYDSLPKATLD